MSQGIEVGSRIDEKTKEYILGGRGTEPSCAEPMDSVT